MSKITEKQYLDMRGFSSLDWTVLEKDNAVKLLEKQGAINNMYTIKESKAVASFGKGAYIVKREWMKPFESEISDSKEQNAPAVSGMNIPKAPPAVPKKETDVPSKEKEEELSDFLITRIANLEKFGWVNDPKNYSIYNNNQSGEYFGKTISYKELENMENKEWDKYILVKSEKIKDNTEKTVDSFKCDKYDNTGESCEKQCNTCKAKDTVKDIAEKTGVSKDNLVVGSVRKVDFENPIKLRIKMLEEMGYKLIDDIYRKYYADGKKYFGIKESYVLESDAVTFIEYVKNLKKQEAEIVAEEVKLPTPTILGADSQEEADKIMKQLQDAGIAPQNIVGGLRKFDTEDELKDTEDYNVKRADARKSDLESVGAVQKNDIMVKDDLEITLYEMYNTKDSKWPDVIKKFADYNAQLVEKKKTRASKKVKKETKVSIPAKVKGLGSIEDDADRIISLSKPESVKGYGKEAPQGLISKEPEIGEGNCAVGPGLDEMKSNFFDKDRLIEQISFVEKQASILNHHAEVLHALYEINQIMAMDCKNSVKLGEIQDRLNSL